VVRGGVEPPTFRFASGVGVRVPLAQALLHQTKLPDEDHLAQLLRPYNDVQAVTGFLDQYKGGSVVVLAELSFGQTVAADALDALFTAVLVAGAATLVVGKFERKSEGRRREAEKREDQLQKEAEQREDQLRREAEQREEDRRREAEQREEDRRREADKLHDERLQFREFEHQTRAALRETYAQFLIAQRRSREASLTLAKSSSAPGNEDLEKQALKAYDEFVDLYHRLNLDASREMWIDARRLEAILKDMLGCAQQGNAQKCEELKEVARHARQNLENSFRRRLRYEPFDPLQPHKNLGIYEQKIK